MKKHPYYDRESKETSFKITVWSGIGIVLMLLFLFLTSCMPEEEVLYYIEPEPNYKAFLTFDGTQNYKQTIYLDTINEFTRTKVYAESTDIIMCILLVYALYHLQIAMNINPPNWLSSLNKILGQFLNQR